MIVYRSRDGRWIMYVKPDQQAELWERIEGTKVSRRCVLRDVPVYRVTDQLAAEGIGPDDLVRD